MTFSPAIPQANDLISQSQIDIQANFNQTNILFAVNHVNFDNSLPVGSIAANRGKHTFVTMLQQGIFPAGSPATAAGEMALYTLALGAVPTLYLRRASSGTVIQMSGPDPVVAAAGQTFLPGGIIMKWGRSNNAGNTTIPVVFPVAFPNNLFSVVCTVNINGNRTANLDTQSVNGFTAYVQNAGNFIYWLAIGN